MNVVEGLRRIAVVLTVVAAALTGLVVWDVYRHELPTPQLVVKVVVWAAYAIGASWGLWLVFRWILMGFFPRLRPSVEVAHEAGDSHNPAK